VDKATESLLLIKTKRATFARLKEFIEAHHPYDIPEIIAVPIEKGNSAYLKWLQASIL